MAYFKQDDNKAQSESKQYKKVVLKRNLVNGINTLTQKMLDYYGDNTRFIIKYDYTIGEDIVIPSNCELKFKRGKLRNGTVNFNHCRIVSKKTAFFNIHFSNLDVVDIRWFYIPKDATTLLQDIVSSCSVVDLKNKIYGINKVIKVDGNNSEFKISNGTIYALPGFEIYEGEGLTPIGTLMYVSGLKTGYINSITLDGKSIAQKGLFLAQSNNFIIDNCTICNFDGSDKTMSWGIRCNNCSNIVLQNSNINNIISLPIGGNGGTIGSAAGVVYENTTNSIITKCVIENVQSVRDGDAVHIISVPSVNGSPAPRRGDLYREVNVLITNNTIKANVDAKRCIKIQANDVKIVDNFIQKKFQNKTNAVSIYGSNIVLENNIIDSEENYTIGIGTAYLDFLSDIVIRNNTINHHTTADWCSCIYMVGSSFKNITIESNNVSITNSNNSFCDLRGGLESFKVINNNVDGGSHFFLIYNEIDNAEIVGLQLNNNQFEGNYDFLTVRKANGVKTRYKEISASGNTFNGKDNSTKMFDVVNDPVVRRSISLGGNKSNKNIGL